MSFLNDFLNLNTKEEYYTVAILFLVLLLAFWIFSKVILSFLGRLAKKTKTDLDETLIGIVKRLKPPFYFYLAAYLSLKSINIPELVWEVLTIILVVWLVYQAIISLSVLVDYSVKKYGVDEREENARGAVNLLGKIAKGLLWVIGILFVLQNLGVNVSSLMAGLGIGGIAIALALQNILNDLFSSFSIHFDKPFVSGDLIVVGSDIGVVEKIGIKTTRLRSLQGEEIVISNRELTSIRINNYKKMTDRRIVFGFGVVYETSTESLRKIPENIKEIIDGIPLARFDRTHFKEFADSSLNFEVVYYVLSSDYDKYMNIREEINLRIKESLEKDGIEMAYPTRTVYVKKQLVTDNT